MNAEEAASIGRHNLERVLDFVDSLHGKLELTIFTVAVSASAQQVRHWCRARGLRHVVQPLQSKDDYSRRYPQRIQLRRQPTAFRCSYLEQDRMRYYDLAGREMHCCFIKDASKFEPVSTLRADLAFRMAPSACLGCAHLL